MLNIVFGDQMQRIEATPIAPNDFDAISPAQQMSFPVASAGGLAPLEADEDDGFFDKDV